jgi:hypothetical protein
MEGELMRKILIIAGVVLTCTQIGGPSKAENWGLAPLQEPAAAEAVLWEGVSALYHFAADPHRPFREELASDYFDDVLEFEHQLKLLKAGAAAASDFAQIDTLWEDFKAAGAEVIQSGLEGVCCTSLQLARVRERAEEVETALDRMSHDIALME